MTISGKVTGADLPASGNLVPARDAQAYISKLEPALTKLDGGPVFLVDDGESGTSHSLIAEVGEALFRERPLREVPVVIHLEKCFRNGWSFRVWLRDNDPQACLKNTAPVTNLDAMLEKFEKGEVCVSWHAS